MPGRGKIEPYHNNLASDVKEILGDAVTFYPSSQEKWYKTRDGSQVEFELVPRYLEKSEPALRIRREDKKTHRVSVFPLCAQSRSCAGIFWVSWYEAWLKQNSSNFILLNAGWTLFEGLPGNQDKNQVLRAEWDQLPLKGNIRAGHPHWHFDHELFIFTEPDKVEIAPGLVEISAEETFAMQESTSVGFIHLAMGTWNKGMDHPQCWQRDYEDDCQQLRDWCIKTLIYLKEQIQGC